MRRRGVDWFSGAGGAAQGYGDAGFSMCGVDIEPQPRFAGDGFYQGDALAWLARLAAGEDCWPGGVRPDFNHASPVCKLHSVSTLSQRMNGAEYPNQIPETRRHLEAIRVRYGIPYVIENVPGSPLRRDYELCGCQFGLELPGVAQLYRPRWFETSWPTLALRRGHDHRLPAISIAGHGTPAWQRQRTGHIKVADWRRVMRISWMNRAELTQAIPPPYAELIGLDLQEHLDSA